jgi:hypothetical protein
MKIDLNQLGNPHNSKHIKKIIISLEKKCWPSKSKNIKHKERELLMNIRER